MKSENLNYIEAIKFLAQRAGIEVPSSGSQQGISKTKIYEINRKTANFYYKNLISGEDKNGLRYLVGRKIMPQTIKTYGLGFSPNAWDRLYQYLRSEGYHDSELISAGV
jgi:DNA primase